MDIRIPDDIAERCGYSRQELTEILAVSLYKLRRINGVEGGEMLGLSEMEFHGVVNKYGHTVNYDSDDLLQDIDNLKDF